MIKTIFSNGESVVEYIVEVPQVIHACGTVMEVTSIRPEKGIAEYICHSCQQKYSGKRETPECPFCRHSVINEACSCGMTYRASPTARQVLDDEDAAWYDQEVGSVAGLPGEAYYISTGAYKKEHEVKIISCKRHDDFVMIPYWESGKRGPFFVLRDKTVRPGREYNSPRAGIHRIVFENDKAIFVIPVKED